MNPTSRQLRPRPTGARKTRVKNGSAAERPAVNHGYFRGYDGTKLFYSTEGKGRPLVFCYGLVCSSLHWTYQIEYFSRQYQTIWFDYRGHQNSDTPKDLKSLTLEGIADDLKILLDELKIPDAVILGHSMGVNVVLEFAHKYPERVAAMILANGTPRRPIETFVSGNIMEPTFKGMRLLHEYAPRVLRKLWSLQPKNPFARVIASMGGFNPHLTPKEDIDFYLSSVAEMDPSIFVHLIENYADYDATPWLHSLKAPTLILGGEIDSLTPVSTQRLMDQVLPNSRLEVIQHGSHCAQMDLPEVFNLKVERFLGEIGY
ncbi:MAG: alpha/beta hydrolase [Bdellovibrionota bacterium]